MNVYLNTFTIGCFETLSIKLHGMCVCVRERERVLKLGEADCECLYIYVNSLYSIKVCLQLIMSAYHVFLQDLLNV